MSTLRTDFVDDVLDVSMDGKRRYEQITNGDGTVSFEDRSTYSQIGSNVSADDLNDTNAEVNGLSGQLTANSNPIYMDYHDGKYGINTSAERGADTFIPFKSEEPIVFIHSGWTNLCASSPLTYINPSGWTRTVSEDSYLRIGLSNGASITNESISVFIDDELVKKIDGLTFASYALHVVIDLKLKQGQTIKLTSTNSGSAIYMAYPDSKICAFVE